MWKCEIPISEFLTKIKFGKYEIPYADEDNSEIEFTDPTEEQLKKASNFLNEITKGDHI